MHVPAMLDRCLMWSHTSKLVRVLLPSGVSVASEARPIIAFYSRFRDICIYIYMSAVAYLAHWLLFGAPL